MPHHLKLYFDPDFDPENLKPKQLEGGRVDHYDLGYVQNVVQNQVLAEWREVDEEEAASLDPRFVFTERQDLKCKRGKINPDAPGQIISTINGWVQWDSRAIVVKKLLKVPEDVDFNTGNILFVGDLHVEGMVRSGFTVRGRNVRITGLVEGAEVHSTFSMLLETGIKGSNEGLLDAGKSIKLPFAENAVLNAGENVLVEDSSIQTDIYARRKLAVRGRLIGGAVHCWTYCYVEDQLGGKGNTPTFVNLGYDPAALIQDRELTDHLEELDERMATYKMHASKSTELAEEYEPKIKRIQNKIDIIQNRKVKLWERITATQRIEGCRLIVPGKVMPGVEISMGTSLFKTEKEMENVRFRLVADEILVESPAV